MTIEILRRYDGKRLSFITFFFFALFCASAVQVNNGEQNASEAKRKTKKYAIVVGISTYNMTRSVVEMRGMVKSLSPNAVEISIPRRLLELERNADKTFVYFYYSGHGVFDNDEIWPAGIPISSSSDDYFSARWKLEAAWQDRKLSEPEYLQRKDQLLDHYASKYHLEQVAVDGSLLKEKLSAAEQQVIELQAQVASLKEAVAQAHRSTFEKWAPIVALIFSALIAFSTNIIGWRQDQRHAREAKWQGLREQELERKIIQLDQQIKASEQKIIIPSENDLQKLAALMRVTGKGSP